MTRLSKTFFLFLNEMRFTIIKYFRRLLAVALFSVCAQSAVANSALDFAPNSRLAEGKWIKISVAGSGVCRITYSQLEDMGFSDPTAVAVYGRGGAMMAENFTDADGNVIYTDDLPPVATMHRENAIYFYSQGPALIEYTQKGVDRTSLNVYTDKACYFLSQGRADALMIPLQQASADSGELLDKGFGYQLFEEENLYPADSGEEYFGWDITQYPERKISFDYSIPGVEVGNACTVALRGAAKISGPELMTVNFVSDGTSTSPGAVAFRNNSVSSFYNYSNNNPAAQFLQGKIPAAAGKLQVSLESSPRSSLALVDYIVLAAERKLTFAESENQFEAFLPELKQDGTKISIGNAPDDIVVWDVATSNDVVELPTEATDNGAIIASGARVSDGKNRLVAFSLSAPLQTIDSYTEITCQNLHALAADESPAMLIITTPELKESAQRLAELHRLYQNEHVLVITSEEIINEFSQGTPDPMAYRAIAKMLYDADDTTPRTFASVLLFGPMRVDHRGLFTPLPPYSTLLCKQTFQGNSLTTSFTIPDYYGMMAEYYPVELSGELYFNRTQDIAIGVIPADSRAMADLYVEKVAAWFADNSVAYWLSDIAYTADGTNENEHIKECDMLANSWAATNNAFTPHKLYNNCFPSEQVHDNFVRTINQGALWTNYLGHASNAGLNTLLWQKNDYPDLTNERLGFMIFGGCTISSFDKGSHGSGESMILFTPHGLIGAIISTRSSLSASNYLYSLDLSNAALKENPTKDESSDTDNSLLRTPRTFGEIDRLARNINTRGNSNILAYTLMCDPALKSLMPTAEVRLTDSKGNDLSSPIAGSNVEFEGSVLDRDGNNITDFNGSAVIKVYSPAITIATQKYGDSKPIDITHDDTLAFILETDVADGKFAGSFTMPQSLAGCDNVTFRLAAFNPETRQTAAGFFTASVQPFEEGVSHDDITPPTIETLYADRSSFRSGDAVTQSPMIYALVTDDTGLKSGFGSTPDSGLVVTLDGKSIAQTAQQFAAITDGGRMLNLCLQLSNLSKGMHTIALKASDFNGNISTASIRFNVQDETPSSTEVGINSALVRDNAEFTLITDSDAGYTATEAVLVITDMLGKEIKRIDITGDSAVWDVTDTEGTRVAPGTYHVRCSFITDAGTAGVTAPVRMVVLREKEPRL